MHGFLSNLTAALLATHTVLGCCWHHAHACTPDCDNVLLTFRVRNVQPLDCGDAHCADAHHDGCSTSHEHHGRHTCQGSTCVFVGTTKAGPTNSTFRAVLPIVASVALDSPTSDAPLPWPLPAIEALLPPLRLHLLHHVLLL
jgi:hypothetical protein